MSDALLTLSVDGVIMAANPAALTLMENQEVVGQGFAHLIANFVFKFIASVFLYNLT